MIYEKKLFWYTIPNKKVVIYKIIISENSNSFIIKVKAADWSLNIIEFNFYINWLLLLLFSR